MKFSKSGHPSRVNSKPIVRGYFLSSNLKASILTVVGGLSIFFALVVLRLPVLISSDALLTTDEAHHAYQIVELMRGGPLFYYFYGESYQGIFLGLAAIPFFWIFGVGSLAYKLPETLFYSLYILSSYWLARKIQPRAALMVVLLMIFSSPVIWLITTMNYGLGLICLLGNLIFLTFFKVKETEGSKAFYVFLLGFFAGFAIYTYTYSIVYIGSTVILFALSSDYFLDVRAKFSRKNIVSWFVGKKGTRQKMIKIIDVVILFFIFVVLFSYVFGGFGIDIAGISILQSNALHKPVGQLLVVVVLRVLLYRKDIKEKFGLLKNFIFLLKPLIKRNLAFGFLGFAIGISPRILSIFSGEVTRGGQGFDVDFVPTNLVYHFWQLTTHTLPEVLGIRAPIVNLINNEITPFYLFNGFLVGVILFLVSRAIISFVMPRWEEIKSIFKLKALVFNPAQFLLVLPVFICVAVIISQGPPAPRYLFPLHGVFSIYTAIYLDTVRLKSKAFFAFALVAWCAFSSIGIYQTYVTQEIVRNFSIVEKSNPYAKVIEFCKNHKILYAYSDLGTSAIGSFLGKGDVYIAAYTKTHLQKNIKERLAREGDFSILVPSTSSRDLEIYQKYLEETLLSYSKDTIKSEKDADDLYYVFSNFQGSPRSIERLRSLIKG